ncbi:ATP-binding protein [Salmonella enterica subsp. enterica serovar Senftenberg]|nr:ATP-binding protein [Salmonella enterica subsp. enterica serovar Senftenberg]
MKTLEQFDFNFQPGIDRKVVRASGPGVRRAKRKRDPAGPPAWVNASGGGAGRKAADAGHRVLFMPLDRLIATLMKARQENRLERQLQQQLCARADPMKSATCR